MTIKPKNKLKKIFALFYLFFLNNIYSQWEYKSNNPERRIEAVGHISINEYYKDSLILKFSKSRDLELSFSIESDLFKKEEAYYVILDMSERKFKVSKSLYSFSFISMPSHPKSYLFRLYPYPYIPFHLSLSL